VDVAWWSPSNISVLVSRVVSLCLLIGTLVNNKDNQQGNGAQ